MSLITLHLKLICLLVFSVTNWPCLQAAPTIVTQLPFFDGVLPFRLETGYVTVDRRIGSEFFYYFVESEGEPSKDPILLWLTGGPGCTSFDGLSTKIGPVRFKGNHYNRTLPTLIYHPYTWTKMFNIIFLDWPAGTGFSFSKQYQILDDDHSINQIYTFIKQWFVDRPNFLFNPFYMGGDSYGGKMVTLVSYTIAQGIEAFDQPLINFKGYLIGNPRTGIDEIDVNTRVPHAYELGIITHEFKELIERNCDGEDISFPKTAPCIAHLQVFQKFLDEIDYHNILNPICIEDNTSRIFSNEDNEEQPPSKFDPNCRAYIKRLQFRWMNDYAVREALGVKQGTTKEWVACNRKLTKNYTENIHSSLPHHHNLLTRGYRALVYSGDHDLLFPTKGTMKWIEYLNFPVIEHWRSWKISGQVAGYTMLYSNNLTFATVKGGGHEAPREKSKECWTMSKRWISYEPL